MQYLCFLTFLDFAEKDINRYTFFFITRVSTHLFEINIFRTIDTEKAEILRERERERGRETLKKYLALFFFAAFLARRRQNCQQDAGSPFTVKLRSIYYVCINSRWYKAASLIWIRSHRPRDRRSSRIGDRSTDQAGGTKRYYEAACKI